MNFTPKQQQSLLSKMGYQGPDDPKMMEAFVASNPAAAAKMGKFSRVVQRRVGMAEGGLLNTQDLNWPTSGLTPPPSTQDGMLGDAVSTIMDVNTDPTNSVQKEAVTYTPEAQNLTAAKQSLSDATSVMNQAVRAAEANPDDANLQAAMTAAQAKYQEAQNALNVAQTQFGITQIPTGGEAAGNLLNNPMSMVQQGNVQAITQTPDQMIAEGTGQVGANYTYVPGGLFSKSRYEVKDASGKVVGTYNTAEEAQSAVDAYNPSATTATVDQTAQAEAPTVTPAATYEAATAADAVSQVLEGKTGTIRTTRSGLFGLGGTTYEVLDASGKVVGTFSDPAEASNALRQYNENSKPLTAATGEVSDQAQVEAAQGSLSPEAMAEAATMDPNFIDKVSSGELTVGSNELVTPAGQNAEAVKAEVAQSAGLADMIAEQGTVQPEELPQPALIAEEDMAQAQAITAEGLSPDATVVAARLEAFTVDNGTLAEAMQGEVNALDTVQGQLTNLMKSFDDGQTPAWAAGAIRAANAAMASRGLGSSSMAGAAIFQAAMESALPIAAQDAQVFAQMNLTNLNNRQQVALANAAAQQGLQLQNLNNEQQAALQNSANAFALQSQNLSNMQQTMLANAQIKAALQGQNLSNQQQSNMATAARYAEMANINLNNRQQTALQNNTNALNIELANLSNKQQAYITNAQLEASLQGKQIDTQQQAAIANAARYSEAANITFTAEQQAALHNSELMKTIGLAELDSRQAAILQNAANLANLDLANLNNRQQAAVNNAKAFLDMDMANLSNEQQTLMFQSQSMINALLSDQAAENAALQFNAASENQTNQFFADLSANIARFNVDQKNAIAQFNAGETNTTAKFNAQLEEARNQFNASNSLIIAQANAKWRQDTATLDTAAQNEANMEAARTANALTAKALDDLWQRERDIMAFAFTASENELTRANDLLQTRVSADASLDIAEAKIQFEEDQAFSEMVGEFLLGNGSGNGLLSNLLS